MLLQPERINTYAQAVIQTMRADEYECGRLAEDRVLEGDLTNHRPEERFVLLAMHKILVERGLCLREHTDTGTMLIFPSYYRRERPELVGHPAALVSYRFNGFLDDIYAMLVVRLHHTMAFDSTELWKSAADFGQSQRDSIIQPRVGPQRGTTLGHPPKKPTPTGLHHTPRRTNAHDSTHSGLMWFSVHVPGVARSSQPRAE